ncbi:Putative glycoside hydrolase family 16, concanavalin A-like lectin/glucanase domain superfamily [Septoria linicola]|uniref:Crh-like protein n=1 Tax=Septoria linicola TaxID=215465 RepID=A0A9Q9AFE3_9PEZI|nr:Putative glycoside hydrolase family 16, concanavalin A-like lectin/glucanase domain superfamily [Septoria linicola]
MRFASSSSTVLLTLASTAIAQTFTDCNPTEKSCPAEVGLPSSSYTTDFTKGASDSWSSAVGTTLTYGDDGAVFSIAERNQAPTIATDFFIFFGRVDVTMKAAHGTGIVSSIVLESADLDEIDWEFVGGDNGQVQSNFYGKGNTTTYDRVVYHPVTTPQDIWHTYGIDWTSEKIDFSIDGVVIRTVPYSNAQTVYGKNFPQTPMQLKLGSWAGGDSSSEGTVEWAGGKVDYSQAPFNMLVRSVDITNYNPACQYSYSDLSGSWESIDVVTSGDSCKADGAASASATQSAVGSATSVAQSAATSAPTASQTVVAIQNTIKSIESTVTGTSYSVNTASISALNSGFQTAAATATASSTTGSDQDSTSTGTSSGPSSSASVEASTGGASTLMTMAGGSLLTIVLSAMLL